MRPLFAAVLAAALLVGACATPTTPAGPVGAPVDLREALPDEVRAALPVQPTLHRAALPIGGDGEAELVWGSAENAGKAYVTDLSLVVTRPANGVEVLPFTVVPPLERAPGDNPHARVGVTVSWRRSSACSNETAFTTYQLDASGSMTAI